VTIGPGKKRRLLPFQHFDDFSLDSNWILP